MSSPLLTPLASRLQDIVMPKLDGVSATSLIRQFDHMTPIISMTSNSKPNEIMTYYHSGACVVLLFPISSAPRVALVSSGGRPAARGSCCLLACSGPGRSRRVGLMVMVMLGADDRLFVSA